MISQLRRYIDESTPKLMNIRVLNFINLKSKRLSGHLPNLSSLTSIPSIIPPIPTSNLLLREKTLRSFLLRPRMLLSSWGQSPLRCLRERKKKTVLRKRLESWWGRIGMSFREWRVKEHLAWCILDVTSRQTRK